MTDPMDAAGFGVVPRWMIYHPNVDAKMILLFLVLSARANGKGICWPSLETLAAESRLSRSTVHETLTLMRERGLLTWETRTSSRGRMNVYRLLIDPLGASGGVVQNLDDGSSAQQTTGRPPTGREVETDEVEPPKTSPSSADDDVSGAGGDALGGEEAVSSAEELFEDFWEHYPWKVNKKDAAKAFAKAVKSTEYIDIRVGLVSAIKTWVGEGKVKVTQDGDGMKVSKVPGEAGKGVPHASTWLNGERWNDQHVEPAQGAPAENGEDKDAWMHRNRDES